MAETITLSKDKYESMKETLEILSDSSLLSDIKEGIEDIRNGRTISLNKHLNE